jgi:hypothetical protein
VVPGASVGRLFLLTSAFSPFYAPNIALVKAVSGAHPKNKSRTVLLYI